MGSLMAGWDSLILDSDTARLERNRSLTRDEIDSFWRSNGRSNGDEQEDKDQLLAPIPSRRRRTSLGSEGDAVSTLPQQLEKSKTFPGGGAAAADLGNHENNKKTGDWWTRSNWAFLNEPPRDDVDESSHKYAAQFHVAEIAAAAAEKHAHA